MGKRIRSGDRIAVLAPSNLFAKNTPDHALFAALQDGQSAVEFLRTAAGDDSTAAIVAAIRMVQRWADYGLVAFVPTDPQAVAADLQAPPDHGERGVKLSPKARGGLGRFVGKAV